MNPTKTLLLAVLCFSCITVLCNAVQGQVVAGISANGRIMIHGDTINVCRGGTIVYESLAQGSSEISWQFNNGSPTTGTGAGPITITYNNNGYDTTFQKVGSGAFSDSMFIIIRVADEKPLAGFNFSPDNICGNEEIQFTNTTTNGEPFSFLWDLGDGTASVEPNPTHRYLDAVGTGTQTFQVKLVATNANTCVDSITHTVTIRSVPDASVTKVDPSVTEGVYRDTASFRVCNNETSFKFSFTNGSNTIASNSSYTIAWGDGSPDTTFTSWPVSDTIAHEFPAGSSTMTVRVTGSSGCIGIKHYIIYVGSFPYGTITPQSTTEICEQDSLTFDLSNTADNSVGTSYIFYVNDFSEGQFFQHPAPATIGQRFLKNSCGYLSDDETGLNTNALGAYLLVQNPCGVNSSSVVPIYVSGKPRLTMYISDTLSCVNTELSLINTSGFGNIITPSGGFDATCEDRGMSVWTVSPSSGYTIVSGTMGSTNGSINNPMAWTGGSDSLDIRFTNPGTYSVKMYVGNERCGMDSITRTIEVSPMPTIAVINDTTICSGATINLGGDEVPGLEYLWSPAFGLNDSSLANPTATLVYNGTAPDTTIKYFLHVKGSVCDFVDSVIVTVDRIPDVVINSSSTEICSGDSAILNASGAETYTWSPAITLSSPDGASVVAKPLSTTEYLLSFTDINGCTGEQSITITAHENAIADFEMTPLQLCTGQSVMVANNSANADSYQWHWGDGAIDDFASGQHAYGTAGIFDISLVATKANTSGFVCRDTLVKQIEVVNQITAQIETIDETRCAPYNMTVNVGNATGASRVEWTFYDSSVTPGEFHFDGQSASYVYINPGNYAVRLVVHTAEGCSDTTNYEFTVIGAPVTTFQPRDINVCTKDTTIQFLAETIAGGGEGLTYQWFVNNSPAGNSNSLSWHFQGGPGNLPEQFDIRLEVEDGQGCGAAVTTGTVTLTGIPVPNIEVSPALVQQQPNYEFSFRDLNPSSPNMTYTWYMGDRSMQTRNGQQVSYQYGDTGTFNVKLVVTDFAAGCSATDSVNVTILHVPGYIQVPNAICPGCSNQSLRKFLPLAKGLKKYRLTIYTSWGQKIFETTSLDADGSPNVPWDGTLNGKPLQQDVYSWQIEGIFINGTEWKGMLYPGKNKLVKAGFITVIK